MDEQREFYEMMRGLYEMLYEEPQLLMPTLHEDDAFPTRYKTYYGKPALQDNFRKGRRTINGLLKTMFLLGRGEDVKLSRRHQDVLRRLGIDNISNLPEIWKWMATRQGADEVTFAYGLFNRNHVYTRDIFAQALGEEEFHRLEEWMLSQGYRAYDMYKTKFVDYCLTPTYANPAWSQEKPTPGFEYKIKHTGIAVQYDACVREPICFGICIPKGMKLFLEHFEEMPEKAKVLVIERTKKCDSCRYCVQTDKTGKRALAHIPVTYQGKEYILCPYFPGYNYSWKHLDRALTDSIIEFLAFMDKMLKKR